MPRKLAWSAFQDRYYSTASTFWLDSEKCSGSRVFFLLSVTAINLRNQVLADLSEPLMTISNFSNYLNLLMFYFLLQNAE